jgi:hypothetical protein
MATDRTRVTVLEGKDAKEFLEYMSRPLSIEEKESLSEAYKFYKKQSKN